MAKLIWMLLVVMMMTVRRLRGDNSKINSGTVKEVDGRLSKLSKTYPVSSMNVNFMNTLGGPGKEGKDEGLNGKEVNSMLFYKMKRKFRSQLTTPRDKPKEFQSTDDVREKHDDMDDGNPVERIFSDNDMKRSLNSDGLGSNVDGEGSGMRDESINEEGKVPLPQSSKPLKGSRKRSGSSNSKKKLDKGINGSTTMGTNGTARKLSKGFNEGVKPGKGSTSLESNGTEKKLSNGMNEGAKPKRGI